MNSGVIFDKIQLVMIMNYFTLNTYIYLLLYLALYFSAGYKDVLFFVNLKRNTKNANSLKKEYSDFLFITACLCFLLQISLPVISKELYLYSGCEALFICIALLRYYQLSKKALIAVAQEEYEEEKYIFKLPTPYGILPDVIFTLYSFYFVYSQKGNDKIIFSEYFYIIPATLLIFTACIIIFTKLKKEIKTVNTAYFISYALSFFTVLYLQFIFKLLSVQGFVFGCVVTVLAFLFIGHYIKKSK